MRLAVIPARGGSKRIPRKNIKRFAGKPMIRYAIEAAQACGIFAQVIVSTDDHDIASEAVAAGAQVPFIRPSALADDLTPTVPVIAHAIDACQQLGIKATQVCCIYPAVPLIDTADLLAGLALLETSGHGYAFPVTTFPSPIQRALKREANGTTRPFHPEYASTRTQDLEPAYHDAGQFYWGYTEAWLAGLNIHQNGRTLVLPEWRCIDIDTPDDWHRAEALYHALQAPSPP